MFRVVVLGCIGAFIGAASLAGAAYGNNGDSENIPLNPVVPHHTSSPRARPLFPMPRSSPALLLHTTTYAYDGHFDNGGVSTANVHRWLNFAEGAGQTTPDKEITDGDHCVNTCSVFYTDIGRLDSGNQPAADFLTAANGFTECPGLLPPASTDWVLHTVPPPACSSSTETQPVTGNPNGNYGNLSGIGAAYLAYVQGSYAHCTPTCVDSDWNLHDYIFQDTTSVDLHHDTKGSSATLEFANDTTYSAALIAFENTLVHVAGGPFSAGQTYLNILNGFADDGQGAVDNGDVTCEFCLQDFGSSHVTIGLCEFCQQSGSPGSYVMKPLFVPYAVNTASQVIAGGNQFINLNEYNSGEGFTHGTDQVGATYEDRYMVYATYMLYYQPSDPKKAILWEDFDDHANSSNFNGVFPEQALVGYGTPATALVAYVPDTHTPGIGLGGCTPSEGDSGGISTYLIALTCVHRSDGRYLGEYGQIYSSGSYPTSGLSGSPAAVGPIAFVINLTDVAKVVPCSWFTFHSYTSTTFNHEILISANGDVLNSGTLNLTGAAFACGTTTIPAESARFLGQ